MSGHWRLGRLGGIGKIGKIGRIGRIGRAQKFVGPWRLGEVRGKSQDRQNRQDRQSSKVCWALEIRGG